tara:strand:+ start:650 stop:1801 length:1152 start_codon:yes stop_codon:yes gene_type:complete
MSSKVLFLAPGCFDKGGISRYVRYQLDALREIGAQENVRALSLLGPGPDGFETHFNVTWHGPTDEVNAFSRAAFVMQTFRQTILWRPDVIHCAHVNFAPLVTRLKAVSGAKTVLNVYGLELWSGLNDTRRTHLAKLDHVIADCHATADHVVTENMHTGQPSVIWDCVDLDRFIPGPRPQDLTDRYGLPDMKQKRVVLTLGRLAKAARHKGYDRLLEIMSDVRSRVPNAHLVIAGRGDDANRLQAKAHKLGLGDCVTFAGSIAEGDLPALYRSAHVFALISDKGPGRGEGIPLTPLEAMASGVPILVGDEDGSSEAVDGSRNGIVVSPRDPEAITNALTLLLSESGTARANRVTEARRVAEERFGYAAFREKHAAFYKALFKAS